MKGFTLIEVLVAMGLAVITGTLLLQILVRSNGLFYDQTNKIQQGLGLNDDMMILTGDIKSASGVATGYPPASPTVSSDQNDLVLKLPSLDSSNNVIDNTYDYLVISPDSSNPKILRQIIYPDAQSSRGSQNRVLTTDLYQVTYDYLDDSGNVVSPGASTKIDVTLELNSQNTNSSPASANAKVSLRND